MRPARLIAIVLAALLTGLALIVVVRVGSAHREGADRQAALQPFYTPPATLPGQPGALIRTEPLGVDVTGGTAYRILYESQQPDGAPTVSSGMLFIPTTPAPADGRPVVAWAHGTIGQGDSCAPSRSASPVAQLDTWLTPMLQRGWVVVATDYAGLGTPGQELYLVGGAEARDVVNSVRAAQQVPDAHAGDRWVVYGHSQGGHAALWTGHLAGGLAPELHLLGVAAAAPAAELADIMDAQWSGRIGWVIGPEVVQSWTSIHPELPLEGVLTPTAISDSASIANECIVEAALESIVRVQLGGKFFQSSPLASDAWRAVVEQETPAPLPATMPMLLTQSTADTVVLAWPNAKLQEQWCAAGSDLSTTWMGAVSHNDTGLASGPDVVTWATGRFDGLPTQRTCEIAPPIAPTAPQ